MATGKREPRHLSILLLAQCLAMHYDAEVEVACRAGEVDYGGHIISKHKIYTMMSTSPLQTLFRRLPNRKLIAIFIFIFPVLFPFDCVNHCSRRR